MGFWENLFLLWGADIVLDTAREIDREAQRLEAERLEAERLAVEEEYEEEYTEIEESLSVTLDNIFSEDDHMADELLKTVKKNISVDMSVFDKYGISFKHNLVTDCDVLQLNFELNNTKKLAELMDKQDELTINAAVYDKKGNLLCLEEEWLDYRMLKNGYVAEYFYFSDENMCDAYSIRVYAEDPVDECEEEFEDEDENVLYSDTEVELVKTTTLIWDFKKDIVDVDSLTLFSSEEAKEYVKDAFYVNTKKGVICTKKRGNILDLVLIDKAETSVIMKNTFVVAVLAKNLSIIVHNKNLNTNYLIDTRGELFRLPNVSKGLFFGPGQYSFDLNKCTGIYSIQDCDGVILWKIKGMSDKEIEQYNESTAVDETLAINPEFEKFLKKLNEEKCNNQKFLFLSCGNNKQGIVTNWLMSLDLPYEKVPNIFEDDDTINIRVKIDRKNMEESLEALYLASKYDSSYSLFNIPIQQFISTLDIAYKVMSQFDMPMAPLSEAKEKMCVGIIKTMKYIYKLTEDAQIYEKVFEPVLNSFYKRINPYKNSTSYFYIPTEDGAIEPIKTPFSNKIYMQEFESKILADMKKNGISISKWVNEVDMFIIIQKRYPDAIYQYRDFWLGKQSIDVYVPSLKIGFEYQGLQHFKPVEFFGGEEGLKKTQERDFRKENLCRSNGVKIIYWNYDEPINERFLIQKLKEI